MLTIPWNTRTKVNISEHRYAGLMQQTLAKYLGILGTDQAARLGHIGPGIECPARHVAGDPGHLIQQANDQVTARLE